MERMKASDFPQEVLKLFDGYVHGMLNRREFLDLFTAAGFLKARPEERAQQLWKA